jgi:U2-associated protein SR140
VLKVLQVWADWFLFSDAFVNGLRSTFLRPGNSGVPPFYTLNGDAEPTKENGGESNGREIASSVPDNLDGDIGQDAALAMGEGAAARELTSLPLAELERRCRHNGLSTRGGIEVMVARLLGLEEAEKLKNQEQEEELKASQGYMSGRPIPVVGRDGSDGVFRGRGEGRWSSGGGWTEVGSGWQEVSSYERVHQGKSENGDPGGETPSDRSSAAYTSGHVAPWPHYQGDKTVTKESGGAREAGSGNVSLPPTLAIPQPEHKAFGGKVGKHEPVLPASKWTREDDISDDDDQGNVKGLALGYSSSGSDELFGRIMKLEKVESGIDNALGLANDTSMDEERR